MVAWGMFAGATGNGFVPQIWMSIKTDEQRDGRRDEASEASLLRVAGDVSASGAASCGLLEVLSMAKPVHAITLTTLVRAKACLERPV